MRTVEIALSGIILLFFLIPRMIPNMGFFRGYYFFAVLAIFSYWIPKKLLLLWIGIAEAQFAFRLMFFDWWLYMSSINTAMTSAFGGVALSDLEVMIFGSLGFLYLFVSRMIFYYFVKRGLGKRIKRMLPNLYNVKS